MILLSVADVAVVIVDARLASPAFTHYKVVGRVLRRVVRLLAHKARVDVGV